MKFLIVTEKCSQTASERDGGARLVESLRQALGASVEIMQFGPQAEPSALWHFDYPHHSADRFERRVANALFIAEQIRAVQDHFTHILFIHICMQFGIAHCPLRPDLEIWTFPMFLTPSYRASGESVSDTYFEMERSALLQSKSILTPSHFEKKQLISHYHVEAERIHVIPRGIDTKNLKPRVRFLDASLSICSLGSIKPQKNTLGLIHLFSKIKKIFPDATLHLIGPVQNADYFARVQTAIDQLGLQKSVACIGYVSAHLLSEVLSSFHIHISTSACETFGRAIFETLALGLPNIAFRNNNAAAEFLKNLPYISFVENDHEALQALNIMIANLTTLSSMACEIGDLYDDTFLANLLAAKICNQAPIAISDYDGTLYHKNDPARTKRSIAAFRRFPKKIVCSARPIKDVLTLLSQHQLNVDWIVANSGSCVANGQGEILWVIPLDREKVGKLEKQFPGIERIEEHGHVIQMSLYPSFWDIEGARVEIYQNKAFIAHWQASKLRAVHRLLLTIGWKGQVKTFGDGPYDHELLTYFDGTWEKNKEPELVF